ncbi:MAG: hypothetical protein AB2A00_17230 [Myxococcota bacterium]
MSNPYCQALNISPPSLAAVRSHPAASTFRLLLVALLERGGPMTLPEVARRFEEVGLAPAPVSLESLRKCRPARPPVYRQGETYCLDAHDDEVDLILFILGLRPPKRQPLPLVHAAPPPSRPLDEPLTEAELDEAWRGASLWSWSVQRVALAVVDAIGAQDPESIREFVATRAAQHSFHLPAPHLEKRSSAIRVRSDGKWEAVEGTSELTSARRAVRERLASVRAQPPRPDPALIQQRMREIEDQRRLHAAELARLRRVIIHPFPLRAPEAVVLVDVGERRLKTLRGPGLQHLTGELDAYDVVAGLEVRTALTGLGLDAERRPLAELGPPQKTIKLNQRGRVLKITTPLLLLGSCGIGRPFGDAGKLTAYLRAGDQTRFIRRLEADAKALLAYYQYGRLHGYVRLRWGFLDEHIPVPWCHRDEVTLHGMKATAYQRGVPLEVVCGSAPGWSDPWSRVQRCTVRAGQREWDLRLFDENGFHVPDEDVQLARAAEV